MARAVSARSLPFSATLERRQASLEFEQLTAHSGRRPEHHRRPCAIAGCRSPDSPRRTSPASTELVMPVCAVALTPSPTVRWPATPTCPPNITLSPITVLPAMPTCAASRALLADGHAVGDLHQVVDLRARLDPRLAHRRPIDRRVGADLDVVFDHDDRRLRDLLVRAVGVVREAEAVAANHGAVLHDDTRARAGTAREPRRAHAADSRRRSPHLGRRRRGAEAPYRAPIRAPRRRPRAGRWRRPLRARRRIDDGRRMDADTGRPAGRRKCLRRARERQVGVVHAQDGTAGRGRRSIEDHRRRARLRELARVLGIGDERDVAGTGRLRSRPRGRSRSLRRPRVARRCGLPTAAASRSPSLSRGGNGHPLEERRQVVQAQSCGHLVTRAPRVPETPSSNARAQRRDDRRWARPPMSHAAQP